MKRKFKSKSNRSKFEKFVGSKKSLKKNGQRKSIKTTKNYGSHINTVNILLGEEADKGVYLLKSAGQFKRKMNQLKLDGKLPYRRSQPAINSASHDFIKYLNEIFK